MISDDYIDEARSTMPELPTETSLRLQASYQLTAPQAEALIAKQYVAFFEATLGSLEALLVRVSDAIHGEANKGVNNEGKEVESTPQEVFHWIMRDVARNLNDLALSAAASPVSALQVAQLLLCVRQGSVSALQAKQVCLHDSL